MAGVVKWLRPRIVVPIFVGSNPISRPIFKLLNGSFFAGMRTQQSESSVKGSSANELRAEVLSLEQAMLVKRNTVDPLNASEQDNPISRPIFKLLNGSFFKCSHLSCTNLLRQLLYIALLRLL